MTTLVDDQMALAESAKKVKNPEVAEAERERQRAFYAKLRARAAEQPTGAQYE